MQKTESARAYELDGLDLDERSTPQGEPRIERAGSFPKSGNQFDTLARLVLICGGNRSCVQEGVGSVPGR